MQKSIIALSLGFMMLFQASSAHALSCVTLEMYLESALQDETTQIFVGTATEVKNHTQVVTVSEALKGWVSKEMWVEHQYSKDWQYLCSNGPAKAGESTIFFTTVNEYGSRTAVQTLPLDSDAAKDFLKDIEKKDFEAGITEVEAEVRASELMESVQHLFKALLNMLAEWQHWKNEAA